MTNKNDMTDRNENLLMEIRRASIPRNILGYLDNVVDQMYDIDLWFEYVVLESMYYQHTFDSEEYKNYITNLRPWNDINDDNVISRALIVIKTPKYIIVPPGEDPSEASWHISQIHERMKKLEQEMGRQKLESILSEFKQHVWDIQTSYFDFDKIKNGMETNREAVDQLDGTEKYPLETAAEHLARVMFSDDDENFFEAQEKEYDEGDKEFIRALMGENE